MTRLERIRRVQQTLSARSHARWSAFFKIEQTPLTQRTAKTDVVFDASVLAVDVLKAPIGPERLALARPIASLSDVVLR